MAQPFVKSISGSTGAKRCIDAPGAGKRIALHSATLCGQGGETAAVGELKWEDGDSIAHVISQVMGLVKASQCIPLCNGDSLPGPVNKALDFDVSAAFEVPGWIYGTYTIEDVPRVAAE